MFAGSQHGVILWNSSGVHDRQRGAEKRNGGREKAAACDGFDCVCLHDGERCDSGGRKIRCGLTESRCKQRKGRAGCRRKSRKDRAISAEANKPFDADPASERDESLTPPETAAVEAPVEKVAEGDTLADLDISLPSEGFLSGPVLRLVRGILSLPILFFRVDEEGRFADAVGRGLESRFGVKAADVIGMDIGLAFPEAKDNVADSLAGNTGWNETSGEFNGRPYAALTYVTHTNEHGGGAVGVSLDVSDWKIAQIELEESERRYRTLTEHIPVCIVRTDVSGNVIYVNRHFRELTGMTHDDFDTVDWVSLVHPDDRRHVADEWMHTQTVRRPMTSTYRMVDKDGDTLWFQVKIVPERNAEGVITGYVATAVDVSESKRSEQDLNRRVAERTAELEAVNRELEAFSSSVSHDLRAPLRRIEAFNQILVEEHTEELSDQALEHLARMRSSQQQACRLIDDLLAMARVSRGALHRRPVNLSRVAGELAAELMAGSPDRKADFHIEDGIVAEGDATPSPQRPTEPVRQCMEVLGKDRSRTHRLRACQRLPGRGCVFPQRQRRWLQRGVRGSTLCSFPAPPRRARIRRHRNRTGHGRAYHPPARGPDLGSRRRERSAATFYFTLEPRMSNCCYRSPQYA